MKIALLRITGPYEFGGYFRDVHGGSCIPGLQKRGLRNPTSREGTQVLVYEDNFDKLPQQVRKDGRCCGGQSRTLSACRDVSKIGAFPDSSRIDFVLANPNVSTLVHVDGNVSPCTFLGCSGAAEIVAHKLHERGRRRRAGLPAKSWIQDDSSTVDSSHTQLPVHSMIWHVTPTL